MNDSTLTLSRPSRRVGLIGLLAVALVLGLGLYAGLRSPWGMKHPVVKAGIALRANAETDLVLFDADDGTQLNFHADAIWWESESQGGAGDPPCLQTALEKARVAVGYLWIAHPGGGGHQAAVWVKCL